MLPTKIIVVIVIFILLPTLILSSYVTCPDWGNCCELFTGKNYTVCNNICIRGCVCNVSGLPACCSGQQSWTIACVSKANQLSGVCKYPTFDID